MERKCLLLLSADLSWPLLRVRESGQKSQDLLPLSVVFGFTAVDVQSKSPEGSSSGGMLWCLPAHHGLVSSRQVIAFWSW